MPGNFLVVGTQRTGSTALHRALNFHPSIACGNEWTQHVSPLRKFAVTERALSGDFSILDARQRERISRSFHADTQWLGFKILFRSSDKWLLHPRFAPALWFDRLEAYTRWLSRRPHVRVIHIVRRSPIEWLKSKYLSDETRMWTGGKYPDDLRIEVPIASALRRLASKRWIDQRLAALRRTNPYLRVDYEDFLASNRETVASLIGFFGCDASALTAFEFKRLTRQSNRTARDYISNFDELSDALRRVPETF
jgi:hypothetical protein